MSSDFVSVKLGSLITFSNGRSSPERTDNLPFPVFGANGLIGWANETNTPANSIVIGRVGSYCGSVHYSRTASWITDNAIKGIAKNDNDPFFLYYLLKHLDLNSMSSGSGQPLINQSILNSIEVTAPATYIQKMIGGFLSSIDDRINLLRETNTTLEAIAQALFKSWFVDFDPVVYNSSANAASGDQEQAPSLPVEIQALFPSRFVETPQGLIPEGWEVGAIKRCCERVESGGTPKRSVATYWNGDVSWLSSGEVRNAIVLDTKEKITALGVAESSAKLWPAGTTVVAMYGATAGEVCILAKPSTANQACCGLIPKTHTKSFVFFCIRREREKLASKSSGSAQQNLNKGLVESHEIVIPPKQVLAEFENSICSMLEGWIENEKKAETLANLRDTLLPRLISGQLRLPEAEAALAEVV